MRDTDPISDWRLAGEFATSKYMEQCVWTERFGWLSDSAEPHRIPGTRILSEAGYWLGREYRAFREEHPRASEAEVKAWEKHFSGRHLKAIAYLARCFSEDEENRVAGAYEKRQQDAPCPVCGPAPENRRAGTVPVGASPSAERSHP